MTTDEDINRVIEKAGGDIRKVAKAYLKASRRGNAAESVLRKHMSKSAVQQAIDDMLDIMIKSQRGAM